MSDDTQVTELREFMRAHGLLPDLPSHCEPTDADADAMLVRVLAADIPVATPRRRLSPAIWGTAASVLLAAAIVVPLLTGGPGEPSHVTLQPMSATERVAPAAGGAPHATSDTVGGAATRDSGSMVWATARGAEEDPGLDALLEGTVVNTDGCLTILTDDGTLVLPLFGTQSSLAPTLQVGARASLGGGFYTGPVTADAGVDIPMNCTAASHLWWVH